MGHLPYSPYFEPRSGLQQLARRRSDQFKRRERRTDWLSATRVCATHTGGCGYECDAFAFDRNIRRLTWRTTTSTSSSRSPARPLSRRLRRFPGPSSLGVSLTSASPARHRSRRRTVQTASRPFLVPGGPYTGAYGVPRNYESNPYGAFYILQENSTGKSNYNALQLSLRITGWHGITSIANYVWSRSMDNSSDGEDFEPTPPT